MLNVFPAHTGVVVTTGVAGIGFIVMVCVALPEQPFASHRDCSCICTGGALCTKYRIG